MWDSQVGMRRVGFQHSLLKCWDPSLGSTSHERFWQIGKSPGKFSNWKTEVKKKIKKIKQTNKENPKTHIQSLWGRHWGSGSCTICPYQREIEVSHGPRTWLLGEYDFVNGAFDLGCKGKVKSHSRIRKMDKFSLEIPCGFWALKEITIREAGCRLWSALSSFKI